ncbi:MAG: hypothetical protein IPP14_08730 [Planctomycetes bacterium]|nr:hypothetical protein [Planctomycetota bacterium]
MSEFRKASGPRAQATILERTPYAPAVGAAELSAALREDARELLSALRLRIVPACAPEDLLKAAPDQALILVFSDTPALPPMAIEAAIDGLAEGELAVGPCVDGSLYLLVLGAGLDPSLAAEAMALAPLPDALARLTDLCDETETAVTVLPPWFRLAEAKDLSFAESLARLSLMSEEGEEDFVADRLRVWFEDHAG